MLYKENYFIEPSLRIDRADTAHGIGGGLLVYVKNGMIITSEQDFSKFNQYCKFSVTENTNNQNPLNILLIYRSPNSSEENNNQLCNIIQEVPENTIIVGDFNYPKINWQGVSNDRKSENFVECVHAKNLEQMVEFPTHIRGNLLDLVLTNAPENILSVEGLGNLGNSDHTIICVEVDFCPKFKESNELVLDWYNGDTEGLKEFYCNINWKEILEENNAEEAWEVLKTKIDVGIEKFIPKKQRVSRNKPQWMTKNVVKLCRKKRRFYNRYQNTRTQDDLEQFKNIEKECKKAVRSAKRKFEKKIAESGNKRPFYAYLKNKTKTRSNVGPLKLNNVLTSDDEQVAKILNEYFCSVFTKEDETHIPNCNITPPISTIEDIVITEDMVKDKIKKLKPHSAKGPDNITPRLLIDNMDSLAIPLCIIYRKSMSSGLVPIDWRTANVTPIFKKGAKTKAENYRPVSLTSIPCKMFESIIKDPLINHLLDNHLIKNTQHGFLSNKSVTTNLLEFLEKITEMFDNNKPLGTIYLDFAKAFDKVPKQRLIKKFEAHGVKRNVLKCIHNWLTGRKLRVVLNGKSSDWCDVTSGVPQGSVLGPLAFIVFINDIDGCTDNHMIISKFADDTKLSHQQVDHHHIQEALDKLVVWADTWGMAFNTAKCKVLHIGRNNTEHVYNMRGADLTVVDHETDLGIITQKNLRPGLQCKEAAKKARIVLGQITRAFTFRDRHIFVRLYKQYIRPHLEFAVPVWSPWTQGDIELLEKIQIRMVGMVSGLKGRNYQEKLKELGLQTLETRRRRFDMIQTFKILKGFDRVDSSTWFETVGNEPPRRTRQSAYHLNLVRRQAKTEIRSNFFSIRVIEPWNRLPTELKESKTIKSFKDGLDTIM